MSDPRDTLISTLLAGTTAENIKWEQANTGATAFIAKRPAGTVTIEASQAGIGSPISAMLGPLAHLIVKDSAGKTVEEITSPDPGGIGAMFTNHPAAALPQLYSLVHEQVTRAEATMRDLTKEFRQPD